MKKKIKKMYQTVSFGKTRKLFLIGFLFSLLVLPGPELLAQNEHIVTGVVLDEQKNPIAGATVAVKGKTVGVFTEDDGSFSIKVPAGSQTLAISFMGMETQEVSVLNKNHIAVMLKDNNIQLTETVIVGYGQQKKASVVGAITQTTGKVLERAGGVSSVGAALTGNLPGVITEASTGMPGEEDPRIVIRGRSSWNGSDPLILVDGIERPMTSVDISSVESISVLKDASATAVFGVKGANGVILITTKRGVEGKASIRVGANATLKAPSKLPGKYDAYDALSIRNSVIEYELGLRPDAWANMTPVSIINKYRNPANLEESERYPNVDWADALFEDYAMSYNANLNVTGGTRFVKYFAGVDFLHEGDLFKKWDNNRGYNTGYGFNRLNVRSNLDFQLTRTTVLKVNLSGSHGAKRSPWGASGNEYTMWQGAYSVAPDVFLPKYSDGTWGYYEPAPVAATNSAQNLAIAGNMLKTTTRINTDFTLDQDLSMITKGLNLKGTISWDNVFVETERGITDLNNGTQAKWINPETGEVRWKESYDGDNRFDFEEGRKWTTSPGVMENWSTQRKLYYQLQLNYGIRLGKHDITAMGLFSRDEKATGSQIPNYREDWVFRATYGFNDRYFFDYSGAYNGSEKFSKDHRFAFFSSGGIGWMVSEEKFMKGLKFLDMFKLKASYGSIGDDNIGQRWLYLTQWAYGGWDGFNGQALMGPNMDEYSPYTWYRETQIGRSDVHWEKVTKTNYAAEFSFLNGLVAGELDFFTDKRTDILINGSNQAIPSYFGANPPTANLGRVKTNGYELTLKLNYQFKTGLRLWGNFNLTHAKDKVLSQDDPELLPYYQKRAGKQIGQATTHVGHGYYNTWDEVYGSTIHDKNDNQKLPGNNYIIDYNGDGVIDTYDEVPYGYSSTPQNTYNATVGFEYKGFAAFVQFYGVNNVTRQVVFGSFTGGQNLVYDEGSYWSKNNTNPDVPMPRWLSTPSEYSRGHRYMYDGSYIRLKNAEISYTFDSGWVKKLGLQSLRLYLNGNNLWVWSKMPDDRESNFAGTGWASQGAYPTVKRFNLGININL